MAVHIIPAAGPERPRGSDPSHFPCPAVARRRRTPRDPPCRWMPDRGGAQSPAPAAAGLSRDPGHTESASCFIRRGSFASVRSFAPRFELVSGAMAARAAAVRIWSASSTPGSLALCCARGGRVSANRRGQSDGVELGRRERRNGPHPDQGFPPIGQDLSEALLYPGVRRLWRKNRDRADQALIPRKLPRPVNKWPRAAR